MKIFILLVTVCTMAMTTIAQDKVRDIAEEQAAALGQSIQHNTSPNTHPNAQWFPEVSLGIFIHWGIAAIEGTGDLSWAMLKNKSWYDGTITPNNYYKLIDQWNPKEMDFDKILKAAKAAGFRYAVFTTKHHDGFTMWPSAYGEIGTKHSFDGRDFVKEFITACRKYDLRIGLYYSPPDWHFDRKYKSWAHKGEKVDMDHKPLKAQRKPADHDQKRKELVCGQITELLTKYGKIDMLWFDGGHKEMANDDIRKLVPGIVLNRRNGGGGDFRDSEGKLPGKRFNTWFEANLPAWPLRMWSFHHNYPNASAAYLLTQLSCIRGWGGNLLANLGPTGAGAAHKEAYECWATMAEWMKHSSEAVLGTHGGPWPKKCNVPITQSSSNAYIHFLPKLPEKIKGFPEGMKTLSMTKQVIPSLPDYTNTAVWKDVPQPKRAVLLHTGETIPFKWESGTLTISITEKQRSGLVDIVKLEWQTSPSSKK